MTLYLIDKLDAVSKIADNISLDTNITNILLNSLKEKEFQDIKEENNQVNKKIGNILSELEETRNDNKMDKDKKQQEIKDLENKLASSQKEKKVSDEKLEAAEKAKESLSKKLFSTEKEILILTNEGYALQIKNFNYSMSDIKDTINILNKYLEKVEENNIKLRIWRENKFLGVDDDREVLDLYTKMVLQNDEGKKSVKELQSNIEAIEKQIKEFEKNKDKIDIIIGIDSNLTLKNTLTKLIEDQKRLQIDINNKLYGLTKNLKPTREKLEKIQSEINNNQQTIVKIYKAYKNVEAPKDDNIKTIAGITQPLSEQGRLVPNISVLGSRLIKGENNFRTAQIKLFVAPTTGEKTQFNNAYRLLIPEASSYGFLADFSFGFIPSNESYKADKDTGQPAKKLGLNLSAYYLDKVLSRKDSSTFNTGMLHFKVGVQYIVIGKVLSVYTNINPFYLTNGVNDFQANYSGYENKLRSFVDFGLNAYLDLSPQTKQNDLFIDLDLGFIVVGGDVQPVVSTSDPLIPRIKVSLVKGFRF